MADLFFEKRPEGTAGDLQVNISTARGLPGGSLHIGQSAISPVRDTGGAHEPQTGLQYQELSNHHGHGYR